MFKGPTLPIVTAFLIAPGASNTDIFPGMFLNIFSYIANINPLRK